MRQISHWRCDQHPDNVVTLITAGHATPPQCDWQTDDTIGWPCRLEMRMVTDPAGVTPQR